MTQITQQLAQPKVSRNWQRYADNITHGAVISWGALALIGQWSFALYILLVYGYPAASGQLQIAIDVSPTQGVHSSSASSLLILYAHILPAAWLSLSGLFQLMPKVRQRYPKIHRWNGRIFLVLGFSGAFTGLYLTWIAGFRHGVVGALGITLNGLLILLAVYFTWLYALRRQFNLHQRWAIHTFILVNAVWSLRIYLMAWYMINQGPLGNTNTLEGPTDIVLTFACYLVPMLVAELVFWAKRHREAKGKWAVATVMSIGAALTLIGVVAAVAMMWLPRMQQVTSV